MAGNVARVNFEEVAEALRQFLGDETEIHQQFLEDLTERNRGFWAEYVSRNRSLWNRMLGRLREAGVDAPEAVMGSAVLLVAGTAISFLLTSRRR